MEKKAEYRKTLNLPKTKFPMRANLREMEPRIQQFWDEIDLYQTVQRHTEGRPKYILHDGPPFSNGDIHLGQALNKVLKDIVIKYKTHPRPAHRDRGPAHLRLRPPRHRPGGTSPPLQGDRAPLH